jgi:RNA polymerase sigma-70 factor, ECF subfamily
MSPADAIFEQHRPALARLAYRMLGSHADADDVLQEAYLRWSREPRDDVAAPRAYLFSIVTRLCIDARQTIEARKQSYVGPWLPEPVVEEQGVEPSAALEIAEDVSMAFLIVLESLSPVERAAYLLKRVFDYNYGEIAQILARSEPTCRQLVSRAEQHVDAKRPRFDLDPAQAERITDAFFTACSTGDLNGLVQLLATDAVLYSDGGGKVPAALAPIRSADHVARFFLGILKKAPPNLDVRRVRVNGQPGRIVFVNGEVYGVLTFEIVDGLIATCFIVRNPDKLARAGAS